MVDPQPATPRRGNVQPGGRYGTAPDSSKHLAPEAKPLGIDDADLQVPESIPGALPENAARRPADEEDDAGAGHGEK